MHILTWLDQGSLFGYRPLYVISHPLIFIREVQRKVKHAYQRVYRGWDDSVVWSLDIYLSRMIPIWLRELKAGKMGTPNLMFTDEDYVDKVNYVISEEGLKRGKERWSMILDKIILGFEIYYQDSDDFWEEPEKEKLYKEGFELFQKYFGCLWD